MNSECNMDAVCKLLKKRWHTINKQLEQDTQISFLYFRLDKLKNRILYIRIIIGDLDNESKPDEEVDTTQEKDDEGWEFIPHWLYYSHTHTQYHCTSSSDIDMNTSYYSTLNVLYHVHYSSYCIISRSGHSLSSSLFYVWLCCVNSLVFSLFVKL